MRALKTSDQIDQRWTDPEERLGHREERSPDDRLSDLEVGLVSVLDAVAVNFVLLAPKHLGQQDPGHRQGLLRDRAHCRQRSLGFAASRSPGASDPSAEQHERGRRGQ